MECNKDEALKAKEVAELKASERDFSGALRFALKAHNLYPKLDGLPQLLTTLYVHTSAQKGTTGETDHYKVLAVEPLADKDTIRKQYKRLLLSLHPDKNKSVGADSAFQIVKEAWNLLSDEAERFLYDQRRSLSYMVERVSDCKSSAAMSQNGFHTFSNYNQSNGRDQWSANYTDPFTTMSWNAFHTFSNYNQSNRKDQWSSKYTDPVTAMRRNGFHTFSNYNQSNGRDQWSASYTDPVTTSQNGYHTSSNYNHSNGRDQRSATRNEPTGVTSQHGFYTSSDYNHSNGMDQRSATPTEPTPMCQNGSHTSSNYKHSNGGDQMSATHSEPTRVTSPDGFYTSHNNHSNRRDQRSATRNEPTGVTSQHGFYTSSDYNHSNGMDQRSATPTEPTSMCQNGSHTSSNHKHSNGGDQMSATHSEPTRVTSQDGFYTSHNNHSNRRDQRSATRNEPTGVTSQDGFYTSSDYNHSNRMDQRSATPTEPTSMCQNGSHTSSNHKHSNGGDRMSATHSEPTRVTNQDGFYTSHNNHSNRRDQRSATRNEPTGVTSQDGFYTSSDYNHSNRMDQRSATPTEPTSMCQNGSHTSSNHKHSNGGDQMSATHSEPTRVTSQDGFYTSHNNHSNRRDQRSATSVEPPRPVCQNDFHTPSNDSRSNRRDQKGATSVEPTTPVCQNDFHTSSNDNRSNGRDQSSASASASHTKPTRRNTKPSRPPSLPKQTFWTVCSSCKMHFEYLKTYLNHHLLCRNCNQGFLALETPAPKVPNLTSSPWISYFQRKGSGQRNRTKKTCAPGSSQTATINVGLAGNSGVDTSTQDLAGKFFEPENFESGQVPGSCAGQTASDVRQEFGESKRRHEEAFPNKEAHTCNLDAFKKTDAALASESPASAFSSVPNKEMPMKKRHLSGQEMGMANGGVAMESVFGPNNGSVGTGSFDVAGMQGLNFTRDLPNIQVRSALQGMIQKEISQKLKVWKEAAASKTSFTLKAAADNNQVKEKQKEEAGQRGVKTSVTGCTAFVNPKKSSLANSHVDTDMEQQDTVKMTVPDPDFHDFDKDRTEKSFGSNQVWAVYDEDDAMPRYYAMVHSVISLKPFKLSMNWLNAKTNSEIAPLDWIACGFSKTSGELRKGKRVVYDHLPSFSHKVVRWTKGKRGAICIYPSKGEVWGLFRNWSPVWNEHTPDDVIQKYDMVQVLEDYNEEQGVKIVPLVKVAGFKTVFRQHWDQSKIMKIPREELFRFSHQVPSIMLTGNEGHNAPKGCLELDPAATPLELLQVESEEYEDDMEVTGEGCNGEDPVGLSKTTKEEALVDNGKVTTETGLIEEAEKKDLADMMKREKERQGPTLLMYSRKCFREDKKKGADC